MAIRHLKWMAPLLFFCSAVFAQNKKIDSVIHQLKGDLADTTRAQSMMRLAFYYETTDTTKSAQAYEEAIAFAKKKNLNYETGNIYFNRAFLFHTAGKYDEAMRSLDTAIIFLDKSTHTNTKYKKAQVYGQMAKDYHMLNRYDKSIEYYLECINLYEKLDKPSSLQIELINTSVLFKEMQDYPKQEEYARKALAIAKKDRIPGDLLRGYTYVAYALSEQDNFIAAKPYIDSAKLYLDYDEPDQGESFITFHMINGEIYFQLNQLDSSYQEFKRAYELGKKRKNVYAEYQSLLQLGNVLRKEKKFSEAEAALLQAYDGISKTGELAQRNIALAYLSNLYEDWNNPGKALEYYKAYKDASDSVVNEKNKQLATSLEKQYETQKKETIIKLQDVQLASRKRLNYFLGGTAILLMIISLLLFRTYRQQQKLQQQRIRELETEQRLNATQSVLKGEEQERARLAKDLHDGLSGMLSGVKYSLQDMKGNLIMTQENQQAFERSIDMLDSSIKEMRRVAHNLMPEVLVRYGLDAALKDYITEINKTGIITVIYHSMGITKKEIDHTTAIVVYRIIQELLNNVIKHAQATEVLVQLLRENDKLVVNVEDNGKGFDTKLAEEKMGMGWENIRSRMELLNGTIDIQSAPENGTAVNLEINIV